MTVRTVLWEMFEKKDVPGAMAVRDVLMAAWREVREDARGPRAIGHHR